jgi:hypothetical protein
MAERGMSQLRRWNARINAHTRAINALELKLEGAFKGSIGREERRELGRIISHLRTRRTGLEKARDVYHAKHRTDTSRSDTVSENWFSRFFKRKD